jgi:YD repeat-containing protein
VQGKLQVPNSLPEMLGLADTKDDKIGAPTQVLAFRDGRRWHFDERGDLAAWTSGPLTVIYRRDQARRIQRIEGWYGEHLRADIRLRYDSQGRLLSARGSNDQTVEFLYDDAGRLTKTAGPQGVFHYRYRQGLLTGVAKNGKVVREFEYDDRGRLARDRHTADSETVYRVRQSADSVEISSATEDLRSRQKRSASARYDAALRPLSRVFEDSTQVQWRYGPGDEVETTITSPDGTQILANRPADASNVSWRLPEGAAYSAQFDKAGRINEVRQNGHLVVQRQWHKDGPLALALYETVALHPEYDKQAALTGIFVTPPEKGPEFSQWLHVGYDELGRPAKITDYSGSEIQIGYDKSGEPAALVSKRGGVAVEHDVTGRVKTIKTSWGYGQTRTYRPANGELEEVKIAVGESDAVTQFEHGRPARIRHFDGGQCEIAYYDQGPQQGLPKKVSTPDKGALTYQYDSAGRPAVLQCDDVYRQEFTYDPKGRLTDVRYVPVGK